MPRNIELKARCRDLAAARRTAERLQTAYGGIEEQTDTYFAVSHGRLKLREIAGREARLVAYSRSDESTARPSDYTLTPVADPANLKKRLAAEHGTAGIVHKRREIFFFHNVRIHLDDVAELGTFIEFEAVLGDGTDEARGREQTAYLSAVFGLAEDDLLAHSYRDLMERKAGR